MVLLNVKLTKIQISKFKKLEDDKVNSIKIRFTKEQIEEEGEDLIILNKEQLKKITSAITSTRPRGVELTFNKIQKGGWFFIPFIVAGISALASGATALASTTAGSIALGAVASATATKVAEVAIDAIVGDGIEDEDDDVDKMIMKLDNKKKVKSSKKPLKKPLKKKR